MAGTMPPAFRWQFTDSNGDPLSAGTVTVYLAGTTTPEPVYQDVDLTTAFANPYTLPASGKMTFFLTPGKDYKLLIKDSSGATVDTVDNIPAIPPSASSLEVTGTAGENLLAEECCYQSDGSGGKTAGSWYKADADNTYSSTTPVVGFAVAAITSGTTGTFRLGGSLDMTGPLTSGASYYVSATAGAITSTAPTNARYVGQAKSATELIVAANPIPSAAGTGAISVSGQQIGDLLQATSTSQFGRLVPPKVVQGRLTLTSGTAVTTADVTAATTLYYTPYGGNQIALYNGTSWQTITFSELSIAVPSTTVTMYDVFVYSNSGTATLELTAWTNDTTRATALTTQDGVLVKTGATTRRYVGSFRTTGVSGQTEDSYAKRFVWNYYHRVRRPMRVLATGNWTYTTATLRQANNDTANQLAIVVGVAEVAIDVTALAYSTNSSANVERWTSIGEDSTSTAQASAIGNWSSYGLPAISGGVFSSAHLRTYPAIGYHYYAWLEKSTATGTTTWHATTGLTAPIQSGISAMWEA